MLISVCNIVYSEQKVYTLHIEGKAEYVSDVMNLDVKNRVYYDLTISIEKDSSEIDSNDLLLSILSIDARRIEDGRPENIFSETERKSIMESKCRIVRDKNFSVQSIRFHVGDNSYTSEDFYTHEKKAPNEIRQICRILRHVVFDSSVNKKPGDSFEVVSRKKWKEKRIYSSEILPVQFYRIKNLDNKEIEYHSYLATQRPSGKKSYVLGNARIFKHNEEIDFFERQNMEVHVVINNEELSSESYLSVKMAPKE